MTWTFRMAAAPVLVAALALPARAQSTVITNADIQKLQDNVYLAERDINQLKTRDAARATQLQTELDDLGDEVIYLRVKLRKERTLARSEYADVESRIEGVRTRARGTGASTSTVAPPPATSSSAPATLPPPPPDPVRASSTREIPAGTELDVRMSTALNSGTAKVEDRFEATTVVDLVVDGRVLVPAGAVARGVVSSVEPGTRTNRTSRLTVTFDQLTFGGRAYPIRGTVTQAIEGAGVKGELPRAGAGAAVGAIIGGIIGGVKGAVAGVLIGGGGTIAATEGKEVDLPQGTVLRVRIESPVPL